MHLNSGFRVIHENALVDQQACWHEGRHRLGWPCPSCQKFGGACPASSMAPAPILAYLFIYLVGAKAQLHLFVQKAQP